MACLHSLGACSSRTSQFRLVVSWAAPRMGNVCRVFWRLSNWDRIVYGDSPDAPLHVSGGMDCDTEFRTGSDRRFLDAQASVKSTPTGSNSVPLTKENKQLTCGVTVSPLE